MIEGFAQAYKKHANIRLLIVGDGPERKNLETLIAKLKLEGVVTLTGFIPSPKDYINLLDVFLLTSLSEGTSMTLLEAMSAGKPSIVTNVGGNPELINDRTLGLVIEQTADQLKNAINQTLTSGNVAKQKDEITSIFDSRFSATTMVNEFWGFYTRALNLKGMQQR